jgi:hypothetical protein
MRLSASTLVSLVALAVSAAGAVAQEPLGVAACDEFFTKYEACIAKMPAAQQPQFKGQMDQMRAGWLPMAANPQTKPALEGVCTQMGVSMKASMAQFGCEW